MNKFKSCSELEHEICWKLHQTNNIVFIYNHCDNILNTHSKYIIFKNRYGNIDTNNSTFIHHTIEPSGI